MEESDNDVEAEEDEEDIGEQDADDFGSEAEEEASGGEEPSESGDHSDEEEERPSAISSNHILSKRSVQDVEQGEDMNVTMQMTRENDLKKGKAVVRQIVIFNFLLNWVSVLLQSFF